MIFIVIYFTLKKKHNKCVAKFSDDFLYKKTVFTKMMLFFFTFLVLIYNFDI